MPHVREQIRSAMVTAVTGLATTSTRVHNSRFLPLASSALPALCVYTRSDTPDYTRGHMQKTPRRVLDVHVEGYVAGDDQSVMDDIAAEVETAVFANAALAALALVWLGEQTMSVDGEGEKLTSIIDMVFRCEYATVEGAPNTVV